jgi:hypothetical protein
MKDDNIAILEEKLKKAKTDKERKEIQKMIATEKKKLGQNDSDAATVMTGNDSDGSGGKPKIDDGGNSNETSATAPTTGGDNNDYDENEGKEDALKGKARGIAKANAAKAKLTKKEDDLAKKMELVRNGRARIARAKERLALAIAKGDLTEDQIAKKQAMIDRAVAGIDTLEASINGGKAAYAKQRATLSKVFDEN